MRTDIVSTEFDHSLMSFNEDGWFNATQAAAKFGKRVDNWLRLEETQAYITALAEFSNTSDVRDSNTSVLKCEPKSLLKTKRGNNGGTWLHPKMAVAFARWLDPKFGVWCDITQTSRTRQGSNPSSLSKSSNANGFLASGYTA